jgi:hypothetical protein
MALCSEALSYASKQEAKGTKSRRKSEEVRRGKNN